MSASVAIDKWTEHTFHLTDPLVKWLMLEVLCLKSFEVSLQSVWSYSSIWSIPSMRPADTSTFQWGKSQQYSVTWDSSLRIYIHLWFSVWRVHDTCQQNTGQYICPVQRNPVLPNCLHQARQFNPFPNPYNDVDVGYCFSGKTVLLLINVFGCLAYFASTMQEGMSSNSGQTFGLAILWFVLFTPCSFICWWRPIYKGFRQVYSLSEAHSWQQWCTGL